ncbi:MAG: DUF4149 domain-containing protein [Gammaproteobacteria bacterium]|nr:MAG: DUF4149 domain-containing protein [Gammaproteobacteria bacterium]
MIPMPQVSERILLTLWVGGMWITGYMVTPLLFATLGDKHLAGNVAARLFTSMSYIGLVCGGLLLINQWYYAGRKIYKSWRAGLLVLMLIIIVVGQFVLQPMMVELKASGLIEGSNTAAQFGKLHGVAAILFLANSIAGLVLVISGVTRP